jgi:hypothetical protein|tara:strand:- start:1678 stop:1893 length:216 start_codon:yes stop_codon:yes gene_type:complete
MTEKDDREMLVRIDERVKTVFNKMDDFETLFTNHLHHHEMWENNIMSTMKWWMGIMVSVLVAVLISVGGVM